MRGMILFRGFLSILLIWLIIKPAIAQIYKTNHYNIKLSIVADRLNHPWGMAFLPDGSILVTERNNGSISIIENNGVVKPPIIGLPKTFISGQGGMLDVAIDPSFTLNNLIYFSYAEPSSNGAGTAVARGRLDSKNNKISNLKVIFRQFPKSRGGRHFGSRIAISSKGELFITVGDRGEYERVQSFKINRGQVIRLTRNGNIPIDNPFIGNPDYRSEIWSVGHRNPQGAAIHPDTGMLWINEHGARGGDEVNIVFPGRNYGWPIISYGTHYSGAKIGVGTHIDNMEQPIHYWDPSIAPSGMTFYTGEKFPKWQGNAFIGALKGRLLVRLKIKNNKVILEEHILRTLKARIRDVKNGPDGNLYILTDTNPGKIIKIEPVK